MTSTNGGSTFSHTTPPSHLVAGAPVRWVRGNGPLGFFQPSQVVRGQDGWHYMMARVMGPHQEDGSCVMRSRNIGDPKSWQGWSGSGFTVPFPSPYLNTLDPAQHICQPVTPSTRRDELGEPLVEHLPAKKWIPWARGAPDNAMGSPGPGFYYYTSDDLINWSLSTLLMRAELPGRGSAPTGRSTAIRRCWIPELDPQLRHDRAAAVPVLHALQYLVVLSSLDRDLIRIPIEFSNQAPGGPAAALAASNASPRTGEPVTFDASGSRDEDGSITKFEWDLDGDGTYERDTGSSPAAGKTYSAPDSVTVTVRVSDDDGKATDETMVVRVGEPGEAPRNAAGGPGPACGAVGRTSASIARLELVRSRARRGGALVRVRVPAAGALRVRAVGQCGASGQSVCTPPGRGS